MLQDLTNNLSKELNQIRKETAEVNKASKALSIVAAKGGMDAVIANQERILRVSSSYATRGPRIPFWKPTMHNGEYTAID